MAKTQKAFRKPNMKKIGGINESKKRQDRRLKRQGKRAQLHSVPGHQQGASSKFRKLLIVTRAKRKVKKLEAAKLKREESVAKASEK